MNRSSIIPPQIRGFFHSLSLPPNGKHPYTKGRCYLFVRKGSVELEPEEEGVQLEVCGQRTPLEIEHALPKNENVLFIESLFFVLTAGEEGCYVTLYYPPIEKKDWGIPGIERRF